MSLTIDIANLTGQVTDLTARVADWIDQADAKIDQALATVPKMFVRYYVDPATGDDTNDGLSETSAFATLDRALEMASGAPVRWTDIVVRGNVTASSLRQFWGNKVMIWCDDPTIRPIIDFDASFNGILWNAFVRFQNVHLRLPANATGSWKLFWPAGFASIVFRDCTVEYPGSGDVFFTARGYGGLSISGYGITAISMAGRWVQEAPAGTDIDSVPGVNSDVPNT